jgi:cell division protein FtsB
MDFQQIVIVAIGCFSLFIAGPLIWAVSSYQEKKLKLQRDLAEAGGAETHAELERLRKRVAVLERLVTDDDRRLAGDIDQLRRDQGDDIRG